MTPTGPTSNRGREVTGVRYKQQFIMYVYVSDTISLLHEETLIIVTLRLITITIFTSLYLFEILSLPRLRLLFYK